MKTQRQQIYRYHLHMQGDKKGQITMEPISVKNRIKDFPKLKMGYSTVPYCIYYAIESFHNDVDYGSQAILKHNICTGERQYWYKPSHFPSEAFFVPRVEDPALADGAHPGHLLPPPPLSTAQLFLLARRGRRWGGVHRH